MLGRQECYPALPCAHGGGGGHQQPLWSRGNENPAIEGSAHLAGELVLLRHPMEPQCALIL